MQNYQINGISNGYKKKYFPVQVVYFAVKLILNTAISMSMLIIIKLEGRVEKLKKPGFTNPR